MNDTPAPDPMEVFQQLLDTAWRSGYDAGYRDGEADGNNRGFFRGYDHGRANA